MQNFRFSAKTVVNLLGLCYYESTKYCTLVVKMDYRKKLVNKNAYIITSLSKEFLTKEEGDRIDTVAQFAEKYSLARGTVQSAIKFLSDVNAIKIDRRGHLGSYISKIDHIKLLQVSDINFIVGVMPLPYTKRYEGLATGLYNSDLASKFSINLAYMRGAINRLESLMQDRYDFAVMSKLAAEHFIAEGYQIEVLINFGRDSYVGNHAMVFHDSSLKTIEKKMKIGIDITSRDQELITKKIVRDMDVDLINIPYNSLKAKLQSGEIDAAVITLDEAKSNGMNYSTELVDGILDNHKNTEAVIVVKKDKKEISKILEKYIDQESVLNFQKKVIDNEIIPNY